MFASLFQGAQDLAAWAFGWLVPDLPQASNEPPNGSFNSYKTDARQDPQAPLPTRDTVSSTTDDTQLLPTPRGSFAQIDRSAVKEATTQWQVTVSDTTSELDDATMILTGFVEITRPSEQDPQVSLNIALRDHDGLDPNALLKLAFQLSEAEVFSPLIQPSIDVVLNDNQTGALVSLEGTANTAFDGVYWRIDARLPDALGEITDLNHNLAIWNTDLL